MLGRTLRVPGSAALRGPEPAKALLPVPVLADRLQAIAARCVFRCFRFPRRAACFLKLSKPRDAVKDCMDVLEVGVQPFGCCRVCHGSLGGFALTQPCACDQREAENTKALFRMGQGLVAVKEFEEALEVPMSCCLVSGKCDVSQLTREGV